MLAWGCLRGRPSCWEGTFSGPVHEAWTDFPMRTSEPTQGVPESNPMTERTGTPRTQQSHGSGAGASPKDHPLSAAGRRSVGHPGAGPRSRLGEHSGGAHLSVGVCSLICGTVLFLANKTEVSLPDTWHRPHGAGDKESPLDGDLTSKPALAVGSGEGRAARTSVSVGTLAASRTQGGACGRGT